MVVGSISREHATAIDPYRDAVAPYHNHNDIAVLHYQPLLVRCNVRMFAKYSVCAHCRGKG
jgi:hypothetical protein